MNDYANDYAYVITPRSAAIGGGWRLQLLELGQEAGGGIFPPGDQGYMDAVDEGEWWLINHHQLKNII